MSAPVEVTTDPTPAQPTASTHNRAWGILTSLAWVAVAAYVCRPAVGYLLRSAMRALGTEGTLWHVLYLVAVWGTELLVIVAAVRLARWPVRDYLGWNRPPMMDIVLGVAFLLAWDAAKHTLAYLITGNAFPVAEYRTAFAGGVSPWWYVLRGWPAFICAPIVEESVFRGFLWRGFVDSRLRAPGTLLATSLLFAAIHYKYFFVNGAVFWGDFLVYVLDGLILGWIRWRSGGTTAPMIAHSVSNIQIPVGAVIEAALR